MRLFLPLLFLVLQWAQGATPPLVTPAPNPNPGAPTAAELAAAQQIVDAITKTKPTPVSAAQTPNTPADPQPTGDFKYLPSLVVSAGGGTVLPGGKFGYWSVSQYLGSNTYATAATEYTFAHGQMSSCPVAGVTLVAYQFGNLSAGATGLGGGCITHDGTDPAGFMQAFISYRWRQSHWSAIFTATKPFVGPASDREIKITGGAQWAK